MSQRTYTGPAPSAHPSAVLVGLGWFLVVATIALQIAFPLVDDEPKQADLAAITVVVFFLASLVHATAYHRWRGFLVVGLVVPVLGWVAERVGYATGYPFGDYSYEGLLGPQVDGVPAVVPLAWAMMAYPAYVAASTVVTRARWIVPVVTAWSLMAWAFFLDPMMVELGAWSWNTTEPALPGIDGIPLTNYAGWFAVGLVIGIVMLLLPTDRSSPIGQPATLYLWVFLSSVVGAAFFFERTGSAIAGGVAMGLVALPFAWRLWLDRI